MSWFSKLFSKEGDYESDYEAWSINNAKSCIERGYYNPENLRELLILTTNAHSYDLVMDYFRSHYDSDRLLKSLFAIALEGEDSGDAPWCAANVIAEFPPKMLKAYKDDLIKLSEFEWIYLKDPALEALRKIE